jgi:hypothetical protein
MTGYVAFCFPAISVTNADEWMPELTEFSHPGWQKRYRSSPIGATIKI